MIMIILCVRLAADLLIEAVKTLLNLVFLSGFVSTTSFVLLLSLERL